MEALVQPEPGTEQALMRKEQINIHIVSRKCVGSCTLEWGQCGDRSRSTRGLLHRGSAGPCEPREATGHSLQLWLGVAPSDRSESSSRGARDDVVVNREVIPGLILFGIAQE